jgi:hypothetical protein
MFFARTSDCAPDVVADGAAGSSRRPQAAIDAAMVMPMQTSATRRETGAQITPGYLDMKRSPFL